LLRLSVRQRFQILAGWSRPASRSQANIAALDRIELARRLMPFIVPSKTTILQRWPIAARTCGRRPFEDVANFGLIVPLRPLGFMLHPLS
jgi:hypothetical protein